MNIANARGMGCTTDHRQHQSTTILARLPFLGAAPGTPETRQGPQAPPSPPQRYPVPPTRGTSLATTGLGRQGMSVLSSTIQGRNLRLHGKPREQTTAHWDSTSTPKVWYFS